MSAHWRLWRGAPAVALLAAALSGAATAGTRHIALLADTLVKSGSAGSGPALSPHPWPGQPDALVLGGPQLTRALVQRTLSDPALRGHTLVLLLRGTTTAGTSAPPAWVVHSARGGSDALLDRERLITATDLHRWLASAGPAEVQLQLQASGAVEPLCSALVDVPPAVLQLQVRCSRAGGLVVADAAGAGAAAKALDLGAAPSFFYLLERGFRCQPAVPGAAPVASWVDRIEWPAGNAGGAGALRWGARCNDAGVALDPAAGPPRLSADGTLLLYQGRRYLRLAEPPAGDGLDPVPAR